MRIVFAESTKFAGIPAALSAFGAEKYKSSPRQEVINHPLLQQKRCTGMLRGIANSKSGS
jgi:hypothetical protein